MALLITFLCGVSILIGGAIVRLAHAHETAENLSIALAFGALLGLGIFDLGPEVITEFGAEHPVLAAALVVAGVLILKLLDVFALDHDGSQQAHEGEVTHIGLLSAIALVIHNIIEGMAVYAVSASDPAQGAIYALGIALHNIPVGMLIFATMGHQSRKFKTGVLAVVCLSTFIGGIIMVLSGTTTSEFATGVVLCFALGMIIYLVFFELLGHMFHAKRPGMSIAGALVGFALVIVASLLG